MTDLYLIELDRQRAFTLNGLLQDVPYVHVMRTYAEAAQQSCGIDAILVPLMSAVEWGAVPSPPPTHRTSVIRVPEFARVKGRPELAIPGVALDEGEVLTPLQTTRLILEQSLRAIESFNSEGALQISNVAASTISLGLDRLKASEAMLVLGDIPIRNVQTKMQHAASTRRRVVAGS